ncbi:Peptidoglycan glycosyltransferase [Paenibacillus curdlanolyticus YK9]|uniref:Peptidoglycan glycosyltransferase n=1 Tax=Paenibacillus curdlanolyticus YK9 TaxID=717606 RepID=E0I3E9_9BACL|nr:penicillin-binding transpeptidase domain-containing protein [Paenibacillus curdlanolyticus]EFM12813.1 Peptidoglycan glycosyltransferase [Paenibacillus curdlanolyticus YK9]
MRKRIQLRVIFMIGGFVTLLFVILIGRLYWVQVVKADFWLGNAEAYWSASEKMVAKRGELLDRNGNVLAMDGKAYTVAVSPKQLDKLGITDKVSSKLAQLLGMTESDMKKIATAKNDKNELYPQREVRSKGWKIDKTLGDKIEAYKEELKKATKSVDVGIYLLDETKRYYPKNMMAAQLIGYVDKEGNAKYGMESFLDKTLRGEDGYRKYQKDGNRIQIDSGKLDFKPSRDGKNITLTIDSEIQNYVEQAIKKAAALYQPKSITAIAVDPNTMEILGLGNLPTANPNVYWTQDPSGFFNHAARSLYEPGSTFKIVTLAGAVQEGIFNPNATYMSGHIDIGRGGGVVYDIKRGGWGPITYLEGLKRSSNVAFVHLGYEGLGEEKLRSYITNFGFGAKTGVDLPGELVGSIRFQYPREIANATFGQGVSVTPIQQVAAVAAVANGGKLLKPQIIKQIEDPVTGAVEVRKPEVVRQVISPETSRKVGEYLEQVVSDQDIGTGKNAYIDGYRVAGKTGTAQKWDNTLKGGKGGYSSEKYVMSFIGYAPVEDPKILVYVVIDEPNDKNAGGGKAAAPVFKDIVQQSLRYMGVKPQFPDGVSQEAVEAGKSPTMSMPDYSGMNLANAKSKLDKSGLQYEVAGKGATVLQQIPSPGTVISLSQRVYLITEKREQLTVPNLVGSSLRDAMEVSTLLDIRTVTEGQGYVVSQTITKQNGERVLKLVLSPDVKDIPTNGSNDDGQTSTAEDDKSSKPGSP